MIRRFPRIAVLSAVAVAFCPAALLASDADAAQSFERLKRLAGNWQGRAPDGSQLTVSYEVSGGGSIVIETRKPAAEPPMISVFHLDRGKLLMTHYCSAGNHPRMRATTTTSASPTNTLAFATFDVQNLRSSAEGHMRGLRLEFLSDSAMKQTWIWRDKGKDTEGVFDLERK